MNTVRPEDWIGKTESRTDQVAPFPVVALSATLDRDDPPPAAGDILPPPWHWLYFLLLDHLRRNMPQAGVARFAFRAVKPIFDTERFFVCGKPEDDGTTGRLLVKNGEGALCMDAVATIA